MKTQSRFSQQTSLGNITLKHIREKHEGTDEISCNETSGTPKEMATKKRKESNL